MTNKEIADAVRGLIEYAASEIGVPVEDCVAGPIAKARVALAVLESEAR